MPNTRTLSRDHGDEYGKPFPGSAGISRWRRALENPKGEFAESLTNCYGTDTETLQRRITLCLRVLEKFSAAFGDEGEVFLLGVPSRINWEGHHVDHQGGFYNSTTDEREMVAVVRARSDHEVRLENITSSRFPSRRFTLDNDQPAGEQGKDWANYVKGALVSLQRRINNRRLMGIDIAIGSDIPIGASLSSSHALVLASALASIATNKITLEKSDAVILVQEGEWYTGSRTGLGDQATMVYGKLGKIFSSPVITREEINPRYVDIPSGYAHLLVNSFTEHRLQGEEKLAYNARVFAYKAAFPLVLEGLHKLGAPHVNVAATRRLAEINPERFELIDIYRSLTLLPDIMTLGESRKRFGDAITLLSSIGVNPQATDFDQLLSIYFGDGPYPAHLSVKGVAMYGLAECWRSMLYTDLIEKGDLESAGRMVYCGHDGDRVSRSNHNGSYVIYQHPVDNDYLTLLISKLDSDDPVVRAEAALEWQAGDYRASIPQLDALVDICRRAGAVSASLTGAGLGGVVTAAIEEDRVPLLRNLVFDFYERQEDSEMASLKSAYESGAIPSDHYQLLIDLRESKRETRDRVEEFNFTDERLEAIKSCRQAIASNGPSSLRFLNADYYRAGLTRNVSVAGAGFIPAPE